MGEYIYEWTWDERKGIPQQNQREEIVRCMDCENYSGEDDEIYPKWCMEMNIQGIEPYGFCAWAVKRKEGGDGTPD